MGSLLTTVDVLSILIFTIIYCIIRFTSLCKNFSLQFHWYHQALKTMHMASAKTEKVLAYLSESNDTIY